MCYSCTFISCFVGYHSSDNSVCFITVDTFRSCSTIVPCHGTYCIPLLIHSMVALRMELSQEVVTIGGSLVHTLFYELPCI